MARSPSIHRLEADEQRALEEMHLWKSRLKHVRQAKQKAARLAHEQLIKQLGQMAWEAGLHRCDSERVRTGLQALARSLTEHNSVETSPLSLVESAEDI